ncbi:PREDICTED: alpha-N-acetylgalactosaminide alpha-2,6-sialyltransferase 2 isoform X2 [Chinchilla lanigera]|uniref:alpha-N-acetylgalactosaminide alpha-2,6-sialyltransferase 2 isoform X2 n=1 Tax=Chinchilla lanigera TaxID=34839 RepID=UPI000698D69D|nr:PREDICTED: alpha-N-acetylgalactosaminide alpha-2,6-sialyltransferase 2 isoform X2 [Chinchilla lanigera]
MGRAGQGLAAQGYRLRELPGPLGPLRSPCSAAGRRAGDWAPAGWDRMGLPRGRLLRLLLLLVAACSGILFALYSSPVEQFPEPWSGARDTMTPREFFGPKASNSGTRKSQLCQRPLSLAVRQHRRFRSLFDLSTPVLLWGGLFTSELWDSLSRHKAPYGWQGLSHQAITSTLSLLNRSESAELFVPSREPPPKCIRLNGAVIKGFERDVGTKTSFYGFTVNTMKNSLLSYRHLGFTSVPQGQDLCYIFIPSSIREYLMLRSAILGVPVPEGPDEGDRPQTYFGPEASASKFKLLHPDFISYLKERFLKSQLINRGFEDIYMPSTGALMLLTALHTCDKVSAYGFITHNYGKYSDHYFEREKKPLRFYANHDLRLEATLWRDLHKAGILWLYQR